MLNYKIKNYIFIFLFFFLNYSFAEEFYIKEPILNSEIYVNIEGDIENEPIVFVHGLGDEASTIWKDSIKKLKDNYYVITFDLPGFGKSSKNSAEYTPEKYAEILDFLTSKFLENREFYLVGHSMGGAISLKYAIKYQEKLKKLLIIDSAGVLHKDAYGEFIVKTQISKMVDSKDKSELNSKISKLATDITSSLSTVLPKDLGGIVRDERYRDKFLSSPTSIAALGLISENWFELYKIKTPTMILWGEKDEVTPLRSGYVLNYLLENSNLYIIKDGDHVPILNKKDEYFYYLNSFLLLDLEKVDKTFKTSNLNRELKNSKGELKDCSYNYLKIVNSNNLSLNGCKINRLVVESSNISIIDSEIGYSGISIEAINSNINITSTTINGETAIKLENSKMDIAGSKVNGDKSAITTEGQNDIIFSLTTLDSPITKKTFHKKVRLEEKSNY